MPADVTARYFDGKSARPRTVTVGVRGRTLMIAAPDGAPSEPLYWVADDIRFVDAADRGPAEAFTNIREPLARLVMPSPAAAARVADRLDIGHGQGFRLSSGGRARLGWAVLAVVIGGLVVWSIPRAAAALGPALPYAWRQQLGGYVVQVLTFQQKTCTADAGRAALDRIVNRLTAVAALDHPISVVVTDLGQVNGFAAPGGSIVLFQGLIDDAESAEELAGVIGHEIGHVLKEHPTSGAIRGLGLSLAVTVMLGGADAGAASTAAMLYSLSYNRGQENEADRIAADLLAKINVSPAALIASFSRMAAKAGDTDASLFNYLSTHPAMRERIEALKGYPVPAAPEPLLSDAEWRDLKAICSTSST